MILFSLYLLYTVTLMLISSYVSVYSLYYILYASFAFLFSSVMYFAKIMNQHCGARRGARRGAVTCCTRQTRSVKSSISIIFLRFFWRIFGTAPSNILCSNVTDIAISRAVRILFTLCINQIYD